MASQVETAQIVAIIGAAYPNFSPTKETIQVYYELLKDIDGSALKIATLQCCAESGRKFAPGVGEIRGAVNDMRRQATGVPTALEAWAELLKAPKEGKSYRITDEVDENGATIIEEKIYKWSHPLVEQTAKMLGFPKFPDWSQESFERNTFFKAYEIQLQKHLKETEQLPEVKAYIEAATNQGIALLADKLKG